MKLRKIIILLLLAAMIMAVMSIISPSANVYITPQTKTVITNQSFYMNVTVDPNNNPISGVQLNIEFNNTVLKINDIKEGNLFKRNQTRTFFNNGTINNSIGIVTNVYDVILGRFNVTTKGTFVIINFTSINTGTSQISLSNVIISNPDSNPIYSNITNGKVIVSNTTIRTGTISGSVVIN